ncbi:MAG: prepilin-type N-terminal cleavage/methylation domain-containing protein [Erysipelotrichaceae bacterium]
MAKQRFNNKGYTMIEMIVVVFIILVLSLLSIPHIKNLDLSLNAAYLMQSEINYLISDSMNYQIDNDIEDIHISEKGLISHGDTFPFINKDLVVFVGSGRNEVRDRQYID